MKRKTTTAILMACFLFAVHAMKAQAWEPQAPGLLARDGAYAISIVDSNVVWVSASDEWSLAIGGVPAGPDAITILKTVDGGEHWDSYQLVDPDTVWIGDTVYGTIGRMSFDLFAFDQDTAFLTTNNYSQPGGRLYQTTDGGATWQRRLSDPSAGAWVRFFNRAEGVLVGGLYNNEPFDPQGPHVSRTQDGGKTWEPVDLPVAGTYLADNYESVQNACQVMGHTMWFLAANGSLYRSKDKGQHWQVFPTPVVPPGGTWLAGQSIAFSDTLHGMALLALKNYIEPARENRLFVTSDGGEIWSEVSTTDLGLGFQTLVPIPGSEIVMGQGKDTPITAWTDDFGQTWTVVNNKAAFTSTSFLRPTVGWASRFNNYSPYSPSTPTMYKWQGDFSTVSTRIIPSAAVLKAYPNPFTDRIYLSCEEGMDRYRIFTADGILIRSGVVVGQDSPIEMGNLPSGLYLLEVCYRDGRISTQRIFRGN